MNEHPLTCTAHELYRFQRREGVDIDGMSYTAIQAGVDAMIEEEQEFLSPTLADLAVGTKVHYNTDRNPEDGIVKELREPDGVWVVYNCAGNWENYKEYTGCKTNLRDLRLGWVNG